ncbi:MAG TPA: hypothetical protein VN736_15850 [Candidatus Limnocylindrales bacterium]|nr:hypothetical protein [Candidatus Limnocylindrales bacterium]
MQRKLTSATTLDNLKREARRWLKALRIPEPRARERFEQAYPKHDGTPVLRDVQHALAREYGFENWKELKEALQQAARSRTNEAYEQAARDFVDAYGGNEAALARLNLHYSRSFSLADVKAEIWRRDYAYRQRAFRVPENHFPLEEARVIVAQDAGFGSWEKLLSAVASGTPPQGAPYVIDPKENRIGPRRRLSAKDWDELIGAMKERRIPALDANGLMTDEALEHVAGLDFVTALDLGGSRELTDDGLQHLARMPQLEALTLSEYPGGKLTDRGLEVLRHLPNLRKFAMAWQAGISDAGVANLRACEQLEEVDLMGSPTGDGAIEALQGKARLRRFSTGRLMTDAGIPLLHNFPLLKTAAEDGARLLIDGPFTNAGLAGLAGLDGVFDLDLFWHVDRITGDGFAHLVHLRNLQALGCDGRLSGDDAMPHIAAIPRLKKLRIQESAATDEGFMALARSQSIEGIWGRVCEGFGSRGFVAFSKLPKLRSLGIGCGNVDDAALARLPDFPALRELTPIAFSDDGFRYVGRCRNLERLTCMYCRETGDAATEHIRELAIRYYYAGLTQITDRSLEILGGMDALEQVELYECLKVTDAGLPLLARLPNLREVHLNGLPGVTLDATKVFRPGVHVAYST